MRADSHMAFRPIIVVAIFLQQRLQVGRNVVIVYFRYYNINNVGPITKLPRRPEDRLSLCVFDVSHFSPAWLRYMQFVRITFQMTPTFFFILIYTIIFMQVRGSGIQVIKMSLKSNSGASTR